MGKRKGGLPDRWLDYIPIGQQIRGVPIIACKVPLKEELVRHSVDRREWFTPDILVQRVPNVGCIVDLTATDRYYNPIVFTQRGIRHEKIFCEGHVIPKLTTVQRFFQVLDDFLLNVHSRGKVLMVHCTHGLNRTGYLVSRYMVERRGFQPSDAIAAFNEARGHTIERANYLQDLMNMTQRVCPDPIPLFQESRQPLLPEPITESFPSQSWNVGRIPTRIEINCGPPPESLARPASASNELSRHHCHQPPRADNRQPSKTRWNAPLYPPVANVANYSATRETSPSTQNSSQADARSIPTVITQSDNRRGKRRTPPTQPDFRQVHHREQPRQEHHYHQPPVPDVVYQDRRQEVYVEQAYQVRYQDPRDGRQQQDYQQQFYSGAGHGSSQSSYSGQRNDDNRYVEKSLNNFRSISENRGRSRDLSHQHSSTYRQHTSSSSAPVQRRSRSTSNDGRYRNVKSPDGRRNRVHDTTRESGRREYHSSSFNERSVHPHDRRPDRGASSRHEESHGRADRDSTSNNKKHGNKSRR